MTDTLLSRIEVERRIGLARSTIYRKMRETPPSFPLPIKISSRAVRWRESEVLNYIESRPRATGDADRGQD